MKIVKVGLVGPPCSGKHAAAQYIMQEIGRGFRYGFSDPIKDELFRSLKWVKQSKDRSWMYEIPTCLAGFMLDKNTAFPEEEETDSLEFVNAFINSFRPALETLGKTRRQLLGEDYFIKDLKRTINSTQVPVEWFHADYMAAVVDDVHFQAEADALESWGFTTIKLVPNCTYEHPAPEELFIDVDYDIEAFDEKALYNTLLQIWKLESLV